MTELADKPVSARERRPGRRRGSVSRPQGPSTPMQVIVDPAVKDAAQDAAAGKAQSLSLWMEELLRRELGLASGGGMKTS